MSPSDFQQGRQAVMCSHLASAMNLPDSLPAPPDLSGSWQVCRYPPSSTTPGNCTAALAHSFTVHVGFALYGRLATPRLILRGRIRFTCVTADSFSRPGLRHIGSPRATPDRLDGQRAVTIVRTFQRTRPVKLRLTHHTMHNRQPPKTPNHRSPNDLRKNTCRIKTFARAYTEWRIPPESVQVYKTGNSGRDASRYLTAH